MTLVSTTRKVRLREKFIAMGPQNLSDTELLALFIGSGTASKGCLQLAQDLMATFGNVRQILNSNKKDFTSVEGLGEVRYIQFQALKEICRRGDFLDLQNKISINNTQDTHTFLKRQLRDKKYETFVALFLDTQNRLLTYEELFRGTINRATIHPRPIVERVLQLNAASLILAHNHPSGLSDASTQDIAVTERIRDALDLIDTKLLDHLVIGDNEVYSIVHEAKWICH